MTIYCRDQVQERQERPHPHAPHPPLCPLYPSALGFSRRKKNKGLAGLFTQCKIELVEVCEEHGSISMGIGRFLSPPPRIIPYNTKLLLALAGGHPPREPPWGKIKVMSESGWPQWAGGLARVGN